jgi:hypothetical protein
VRLLRFGELHRQVSDLLFPRGIFRLQLLNMFRK